MHLVQTLQPYKLDIGEQEKVPQGGEPDAIGLYRCDLGLSWYRCHAQLVAKF